MQPKADELVSPGDLRFPLSVMIEKADPNSRISLPVGQARDGLHLSLSRLLAGTCAGPFVVRHHRTVVPKIGGPPIEIVPPTQVRSLMLRVLSQGLQIVELMTPLNMPVEEFYSALCSKAETPEKPVPEDVRRKLAIEAIPRHLGVCLTRLPVEHVRFVLRGGKMSFEEAFPLIVLAMRFNEQDGTVQQRHFQNAIRYACDPNHIEPVSRWVVEEGWMQKIKAETPPRYGLTPQGEERVRQYLWRIGAQAVSQAS